MSTANTIDSYRQYYSPNSLDAGREEFAASSIKAAMTKASIKLLLVEDEDDFRDSCARWMTRKGHHVLAASNGADALSLCASNDFDVAVFDMNMPGMSGMELLQRVMQEDYAMEVIILTGQGTIDMAVEAMKLGACDFLTKPCALADLEHRCQLALSRGKLKRENKNLKEILSRSTPSVTFVGESRCIKQVRRMIAKVAPSDRPVLIQGESGTGKEVVARLIQQQSGIADRPFVTINCAALPEQLVESELFGHTKGAFTNAVTDKPGLFEIADGGTLFIDEIGELPLQLQPKLLRVLEDGSLRRIGSSKEINVNVRIIAATNRNLRSEVQTGNFREDLFYRIDVLTIQLPALRDREEDILLLIHHFLGTQHHIDEQAMKALCVYRWPGNVRQLINVIHRATIMADRNEITIDDLPEEIAEGIHQTMEPDLSSNQQELPASHSILNDTGNAPLLSLDHVINEYVQFVLGSLEGNKAKAARVLGIHRRKLYRLLERFDSKSNEDS